MIMKTNELSNGIRVNMETITKQEILKAIKEYSLFSIDKKDYFSIKSYHRFTPNEFYRILRQNANKNKTSLISEYAVHALAIMNGVYLSAKEIETILN